MLSLYQGLLSIMVSVQKCTVQLFIVYQYYKMCLVFLDKNFEQEPINKNKVFFEVVYFFILSI